MERKAKCPHCEADYASQDLRHASPEGSFWVCIECSFRCRACGFRVPLNHLDMDGGVQCARCGLDQAFQVQSWRSALGHAHAVTEMFGHDAGKRSEDIAHLGHKHCSVTQTVGGENAFEVTSSPGHPLCTRCRAPVEATSEDSGALAIVCAACGTRDAYALPGAARKMMHGALRGVIAAEHRTDRASVRVEETPGAIAVHCPSCTAPLPPPSGSKYIECPYCKTVSRIADRTWFQLNGKEPVSEPIWLLFQGTSWEHQALDGAAQKAERKAELRAEEARHVEARREERQHAEEERRRAQAAPARVDAPAAEVAVPKGRGAGVYVGWFAGVVMLAGGAVAAGFMLQSGPSGTTTPVATPRDAGVAVVPPPVATTVRSCACTSRTGGGTDQFLLLLPTSSHDWQFDWTHSLGFVETESTLTLAGAAGAALFSKRAPETLRMGIACDGSTVALVAGNRVSGWSGTGAPWTTTLPGSFVAKAADGSTVAGGIDVACESAIAVDHDLLPLALSGGKHVKVSMKDGRLK